MKKLRLLCLSMVFLSLTSCGTNNMVFIAPGEYRPDGKVEENHLNVTSETYFIARLTDYSTFKGEADSFEKQNRDSDEKGHWYISGEEYLMDVEWRNCDFVDMPSFYGIGCNGNYQMLQRGDHRADVLGIRKSDSRFSLEIDYFRLGTKESISFLFTQVIDD